MSPKSLVLSNEHIAARGNDQQLVEVLGEPFVWYEEPIVTEPENNAWSLIYS